MYYTCLENDELDSICREYYGYSRGSVEAVLANEKNRELAEKLPLLTVGDVVYLPALAQQVKPTTTTNLWG